MNGDAPKWVQEHPAGIVRPVSTALLLGGFVILTGFAVMEHTPTLALVAEALVDTLSYLTVSTVLWWFSGRLVGRR